MSIQTDNLFIYYYYYYFILFYLRFEPRFHQQVILQISRHTSLNSNFIPHRPYANVLVINILNK